MILLKSIISFLEEWAPTHLAQDFDNSGLQMGDLHQSISSVLVAVDLDETVFNFLNKKHYDLVITHHPLFFKPISSILFHTDMGRMIQALIQKQTSLYSMHTNLDVAVGGVNDCLIQAFGFQSEMGKLLRPQALDIWYKMMVYVPEEKLEEFRRAVFQKFPSPIGKYNCCSFSTKGEGTFYPLPGAMPHIGKVGELEKVLEVKFEFLIRKEDLQNCIDFIRKNHPYEEPAFDVYEEKMVMKKTASAKYFKIKQSLSLDDLTHRYPCVVRGKKEPAQIKTVAFACGNGKYLIGDLIQAEIDVLITGELDYHSALTCERNGITVIELGHRESESFVLPEIRGRLQKQFQSLIVDVL